jgi:hypothetical protein
MSTGVESGRRRAARLMRPGSVRARAWNQKIRRVVRSDTPEALPFFCECGIGHCHSSVWLTMQEARDLIDSGRLIIGAHFFEELEARLRRPA